METTWHGALYPTPRGHLVEGEKIGPDLAPSAAWEEGDTPKVLANPNNHFFGCNFPQDRVAPHLPPSTTTHLARSARDWQLARPDPIEALQLGAGKFECTQL